MRLDKILLDTNLLLLKAAGATDIEIVGRHKRLYQFTPDDWSVLDRVTARASMIYTTPHILAEASNLLAQTQNPDRDAVMSRLADEIYMLEEVYEEASLLAKHEIFGKFGMTDAAIASLAKRGIPVITDDFPIAGWLESRGAVAVNFNNLRRYDRG